MRHKQFWGKANRKQKTRPSPGSFYSTFYISFAANMQGTLSFATAVIFLWLSFTVHLMWFWKINEMEYMVVVWFITRLETVHVYTWHTPSKAEGAILLQSYYITAPETTGETWSCRRRFTAALQCRGQWEEAAPLGKGSQEPRVIAGPAGEGLHWQGRRAGLLVATRASQESRWPDKPVGMRQVTHQGPDQHAWPWLQHSCNGA